MHLWKMQFLSFDIIIYWDKKANEQTVWIPSKCKKFMKYIRCKCRSKCNKKFKICRMQCFTNLSCRGFTYYVQQHSKLCRIHIKPDKKLLQIIVKHQLNCPFFPNAPYILHTVSTFQSSRRKVARLNSKHCVKTLKRKNLSRCCQIRVSFYSMHTA